jgi:hypothetical protein
MKTLDLLVLAGLALPAAAAFAQSKEPEMQLNSRARITAPTIAARPLVGRVTSRDSAVLILRSGLGASEVAVPMRTIELLEISKGHQRGRWALAGFGLGIGVGFVAGAAAELVHEGPSGDASFAPIGGAFLGMIVGPLIGAIAAPERWRQVAVPR